MSQSRVRAALLGAGVLISVFGAAPAGASASPGISNPDGGGYYQFTLTPGESAAAAARVCNAGDTGAAFRIAAVDGYTSPYAGLVVADFNDPQGPPIAVGQAHGDLGWITLARSTLWLGANSCAAGGGQTVPFEVTVPSSATPGDYVGYIVNQAPSQPPSTGCTMCITSVDQAAMAVVVHVPGTMGPAFSIGAATLTETLEGSQYAQALSLQLTSTGDVLAQPVITGGIVDDATGATEWDLSQSLDTFRPHDRIDYLYQAPASAPRPLSDGPHHVALTLRVGGATLASINQPLYVSDLHLEFGAASLSAGAAGPVQINLRDAAGNPVTAAQNTGVSIVDSTPSGGVAASAAGPFDSSVNVTIAAGTSTAAVYVLDSVAGTHELLASTTSDGGGVSGIYIQAAAAAQVVVQPQSLALATGGTAAIVAWTQDAYGNLSPADASWSLSDQTLAALDATAGNWVDLSAGPQPGTLSVSITDGSLTASVPVSIVASGLMQTVTQLSPQDVVAGRPAALSALVSDSDGNPLPGHWVSFTVGNQRFDAISGATGLAQTSAVINAPDGAAQLSVCALATPAYAAARAEAPLWVWAASYADARGGGTVYISPDVSLMRLALTGAPEGAVDAAQFTQSGPAWQVTYSGSDMTLAGTFRSGATTFSAAGLTPPARPIVLSAP